MPVRRWPSWKDSFVLILTSVYSSISKNTKTLLGKNEPYFVHPILILYNRSHPNSTAQRSDWTINPKISIAVGMLFTISFHQIRISNTENSVQSKVNVLLSSEFEKNILMGPKTWKNSKFGFWRKRVVNTSIN